MGARIDQRSRSRCCTVSTARMKCACISAQRQPEQPDVGGLYRGDREILCRGGERRFRRSPTDVAGGDERRRPSGAGHSMLTTAPLARQTPDGKPVYNHGIHKLNDTAEPAALIRNALTSQYDQNAIVVLAGPATNLVKILDLPGVSELIAHKVRFSRSWREPIPTDRPIPTLKPTSARRKRLFAEWPTPIVAAARTRSRAAVSRRKHRTRLRLVARASGRRRLPRLQGDAIRCAELGT